MAGGSMASYGAYEAERLSRPDKNNAAYLAVLESVAASGKVDERLYLDDELGELLTMSGGRMLSHLRYAFLVRGQEQDTIQIDEERLWGAQPRLVERALAGVAPSTPGTPTTFVIAVGAGGRRPSGSR